MLKFNNIDNGSDTSTSMCRNCCDRLIDYSNRAGRIRATLGIGAVLNKDELTAFDSEQDENSTYL